MLKASFFKLFLMFSPPPYLYSNFNYYVSMNIIIREDQIGSIYKIKKNNVRKQEVINRTRLLLQFNENKVTELVFDTEVVSNVIPLSNMLQLPPLCISPVFYPCKVEV